MPTNASLHETPKPIDPFALDIMQKALGMIRSSVSQRSQSYEEIAEEIARLLFRAACISHGIPDGCYDDAECGPMRERYQDEARAAVLRQTELLSTAKSRAVDGAVTCAQAAIGIMFSEAEQIVAEQAAREAFSELPRQLGKIWDERIASAVVADGREAGR